jgi:DNA polymerase-3 subunit alpha
VHTEALKRSGLALYPPCVNRYQVVWTQEVSGIRAALGAIRALDSGVAQAVVEERQRGGPTKGLPISTAASPLARKTSPC